jgi:hypothetical protein
LVRETNNPKAREKKEANPQTPHVEELYQNPSTPPISTTFYIFIPQKLLIPQTLE